MEDEVFNQEDVLQDDASGEDNISSDQSSTLEDKLDHIEALINEDIALHGYNVGDNIYDHNYEENGLQLYSTSSGQLITESGVEEPNYNQYIYDLLTDSTIKVEVVRQDIMSTPLNDYNLTDALLVVTLLCLFGMVLYNFIEKHVFKRRR